MATPHLRAQVNTVAFGKNRVQYKKLKWKIYQSQNFNVYFNGDGESLAKYVMQAAEAALPIIESAAEYSLQKRANIILFNQYADYQQTNIGLASEIVSAGTNTKLVNNKMLVYFDGNHENLLRQIRQGISDILTKNVLFGGDITEVASNQNLLDLPEWYTEGYVSYLGENWNTSLDESLRIEILSGKYSKFLKLAYKKPLLAGHAFWYFVEEQFGKDKTALLLRQSINLKSLSKASKIVFNKSLKTIYQQFMAYEEEKYLKDIDRRKPFPKGSYVEGFDITPQKNYYRFNVNPIKRNTSYLLTKFNKGIVSVILSDDDGERTLIKYGDRCVENEMNPNYPIMAWDPKGTKVAVVYVMEGRIKLFVYDVEKQYKQFKIDLTDKFTLIQDMKYMYDSRSLVFSAVKKGHTDIFTFDLETEKVKQITDDVYDDLDPSFVTFPNKMGIVFSSNRPNANIMTNDTALPSNNRFNIFLATEFGDKAMLNQITQLTNLKLGNARYPAQYNVNHFTFVSDENGIGNRYAGFFSTKNAGLDTLVLIGNDLLKNPTATEIATSLKTNQKNKVDSVAYISITQDSTATFPLTNYESSILETRSAGDERIVSEVKQDEDQKTLYKLKVDETLLKKRNLLIAPTEYIKKIISQQPKPSLNKQITYEAMMDSIRKFKEEFQTEFTDEKKIEPNSYTTVSNSVLKKAKLFNYNPVKFSADYGSLGFNNSVLYNKYQLYTGGSGPIMLNSNSQLNGLVTFGASDVLEDVKFTGAFKIGNNLKDNEWLVSYQNLRRRCDWGATIYRNASSVGYAVVIDTLGNQVQYAGKLFTNLYQGNIAYAFNKSKSIRLTTGIRSDYKVISNQDVFSSTLKNKYDFYSVSHLELVHDNSLINAVNILNGLRYKAYIDWNRQIYSKSNLPPSTFNFGFESRYYYPIYRNFIWAFRTAADFSWGNQKMIYYLGGVDGWFMFGANKKSGTNEDRYFNENNQPDPKVDYGFQSLAVNMRGHIQNDANGNNAIVFNSEFRLPLISTFLNTTISSSFLRDLQLTQFIDVGTAWNGEAKILKRPYQTFSTDSYGNPTAVSVKQKADGIGPFIGGYGFGVRTTLFGYFVKFDKGWPISTTAPLFSKKPISYLSFGLDF